MNKLLLTFLLVIAAGAQVPVRPIQQPHMTFSNAIGAACAGCSLHSYIAGTTTPQTTYTDSSGSNTNTNPIILGADGGANIWLSSLSYKLVLIDTFGNTVWSVDNVSAASFPCAPSKSVQIANTASTGFSCDSSITIDTSAHTFNVGTLGANYVSIGALGTPTRWAFDTTTPTTALASLGGAPVGGGGGTANQLAFYAATGAAVTGTSAIPTAITATTQSPGSNNTRVATTAYVALPGAIAPSSLKIAAGTAMTGNQGNGTLLQHSTGATTTGAGAVFDANGNIVASTATPRTCNSNGCYRIASDGTIEQWGNATGCSTSGGQCTATVTFPIAFTTTTNLSVQSTCVSTSTNCAIAASAVTTTGFTGDVGAVVRVGGSGSDLTAMISWSARGN